MAYMSKEEVAAIREKLKQEFGKRFKFSVRMYHHMGVDIVIKSGDLDFGTQHEQVAQWRVDEHWKHNPEAMAVLQKIVDLVNSVKQYEDRNAGDPYADYGASNYFLHLSVGSWNSPYQLKQ